MQRAATLFARYKRHRRACGSVSRRRLCTRGERVAHLHLDLLLDYGDGQSAVAVALESGEGGL